MDLTEQIDGYCERMDFSFWAEPVNALTNLAFLVAAVVLWRRSAGVPMARALAAVLFAIGIGSFLFHTLATGWAALADTLPILGFILLYLFAVHRDVLAWPGWAAGLATAGFLPYAAGVTVLLRDVPFFGVSSFYWTVPILLVIYGIVLRHRFPALVRGFAVGAALLSLSITARSLDETLCAAFPVGTHLFWHLLNAVMLGWMIEIYRRHMLEGRAAGR
ncbi:MAG: ceramidase domain-containing protein [Salibaculum sp.]|uniref:ceramidase domain-containing protein n=1 Tax=Roseovarius halophilus (ex Wu et al. 2025) TaxID=3376060 RepID=UPI00287057C2|nr:ceramidase domain-containing protein [Salibaculum sp.]MDR9428488.1 ceramidase domain-containing protein [Salibaculum sp.]MDR9482899.1 ceramidase domain-containing protein [Salibaculum sp.]